MDILYASTSYPPAIGGAQIHLHFLAKQMQALGHGVRVVTHTSRNRTDWLRLSTFRSGPRAEYVHEGVPVSQLGFSRACRLRMLPWALSYYALMGPAVRQLAGLIGPHLPSDEPSLVHVSRIGREFLAQAALDYARQWQIPFVLTPNHHPRWHGPLYYQYDKIYRAADAVFALTSAEKDLLVRQKRVKEERVHVTGIGPVLAEQYSEERFRARFGIEGPFVLCLGQQLRYKGIASILEAAPQVWRRHPEVQFVFVGPKTDYSRKLFARMQDKRLINLGRVDLESKTAALAACELLCLPSQQESFGGVYVEAWSMRKAVIGGRIPPIAEVIDEGRDGLLSSPCPDELAMALDRLLSDQDERMAMAEAGWQKVQQKYSWQRIAQKTQSVYQSLHLYRS